MSRRADVLAWGAIVLFAAASAALGWWLAKRTLLPPESEPPSGLAVVAVGEPLPAWSLPELVSGQPRELSGPGRARLINYWASWCGPCRKEMPVLDAFATEQAGNGTQVIGIALDTRDEALAFQRQHPVGFTLLLEAPGPRDSSVRLGNRRGILPYSVLVDAQGRVVKTHYGAFDSVADVRAWVSP